MDYKLFNDIYFERARRYVKNEVLQEEVDLYALGAIRKIYSSFEELLFDNIEYYSRIIRTILYLYENTIVSNGKILSKIDKVKYKIPMTPTKFYYIIFANSESTKDEILYGYPQISNTKGTDFVSMWNDLTKIGSFAFNVAFVYEQFKTRSYMLGLQKDVTDPAYLQKVIVNSSFIYIDRQILAEDIGKVMNINERTYYLYEKFAKFITSRTIVDCRPNGVSYIGPCYSEEVKFGDDFISRSQIGLIESTYDFDIHLAQSMRDIKSRAHELVILSHSLDNLKLICSSMITNYRRRFKAVRINPDGNGYSFVLIKKFWNNFRVIETYVNDKEVLYKRQFNMGKLHKVVNYLLLNGYFVYTIGAIEDCMNVARLDDPDELLNHFTEYINRTFVDSTLRVELMERETQKIVKHLMKYEYIEES